MKFKKEFLQDMVWEDNDETKLIEDKITDTTRWSVLHTVVFAYKDTFYRSHYSCGATENQDESPYENDAEDIECTEVKPVHETITRYRKV